MSGRKTVLHLIRQLGNTIEFTGVTQQDYKDYAFIFKKLKPHEQFLFTELLTEKVACMNALSDSITILIEVKKMLEKMLKTGCIKNIEECGKYCDDIDNFLKLDNKCPK